METIKLLIIEDDNVQIEAYEDAVEEFNKKYSERKIVLEIKKNFEDSKEALLTPLYDGAIIDLKLSNSTELEGKILVEQINRKLRIPVIVHSGNISEIDDIETNILLSKKVRGDDLVSDMLNDIVKIYDTGITRLLRQGGDIDSILTDIFWKHLSDSLFDLNAGDPIKVLTRYIASHLQEFLETDESGEYENLHPAEFYIFPPIKSNLSTGDIIRCVKENIHYLLLTPACDIQLRTNKKGLIYRNADSGLLIKLVDWNRLQNFETLKSSTGKSNDTLEMLKNFIQNKKERYHFFPPYKTISGFFADFQDLKTINIKELENEKLYLRDATVSQFFLKDIIARFSQYYSRQGQPSLMGDYVMDVLLRQNDAIDVKAGKK